MASLFQLKRTDVSGRLPTTAQLELGELAVNTYDGVIFLKKDISGTETIVSFVNTDGQQTLSNKTLERPVVNSSSATVSPLRITATSLNDGVGAIRVDSVEPDIYLNDTNGGSSTVIFSNNSQATVAFGRNSSDNLYLATTTDGVTWRNDVLEADHDTGNITVGYDLTVNGDLVFSDASVQTTAAFPLTVSTVDINGQNGTEITAVKALRFDEDSGFDVTDLGSGEVKIGMNSTFKTWRVDGQSDLVAQGLDTIELVAGSGIVLATDPNGSPNKTLTIAAVDKTVKLYQDGVLEPTIGTVRWHNPADININKIVARVADAPAVNLTVNINKNGTLTESIVIAANSSKNSEIVDIDMLEDDYLTVDITFAGGYGGSGLSVEFTYSFI